MYFDKDWDQLSSSQKKELKDIFAVKEGESYKGAKDSWKNAKAKAQGYKDLADKKEQRENNSKDWGPGNTLTGPINATETPKPGQPPAAPTPSPTPAPTPEPTSPTPSPTPAPTGDHPTPEELGMKYKDENYYKAIGVESPAAKSTRERNERLTAARNYNPHTYDDPNSGEAIAARQNYLKQRQDEDSDYYDAWKSMDASDPRKVYDPSANEGYDQDLTPGQQLKQWHMSKAYKQKMEEEGLDWNAAGGYHNYNFDMTKGYFVPNESLRQQRAQMYDNMYMRGGSDRARLGDRHAYIHDYFDPLNGSFEYDNTYDMQ